MFSYIKGEITKKGIDFIILENNYIGYYINTSLSTLNKISDKQKILINTYMHVREDVLALYGFLTSDEMEMFKKLISVSGIGPKVGLSVLSTYETNTFKEIILMGDISRLSKVPGIGKKTAAKIILDLKDKLGTLEEITGEISYINNEGSDVLDALTALGFSYAEVKRTLDNMDLTGKTENDIIKEALKKINRQG